MNNYMVYCLTCRVNGKQYIGITSDFHGRWYDHQRKGYVIGNAIRKHGKENFRISILYSRMPKDTAKTIEKQLIKKMKTLSPNGYNISSGGEGGDVTAGMTESEYQNHCKKISESLKGNKNGVGNQNHLGYRHADESKQLISDALKNWHAENESPMKGKKRPDLTERNRSRRILLPDDDRGQLTLFD